MVSRPTQPSLLLLATLAPVLLGAQERGGYPAADHGGNYMHNFYIPPAPSSTPWYPSWHPDDETVTVAMGGSIWSVEPESGVATQLTSGPAYHSSPAWSPDGRWLVHTADENGHRIGLRVLDTETGDAWMLTDDDHLHLDPVFSPSGDRLAYVSTRLEGYFNVYVRPIENGRWTGPAVAVTRDARYERSRLYFGPWDMHLQPAWTPDGEELRHTLRRLPPHLRPDGRRAADLGPVDLGAPTWTRLRLERPTAHARGRRRGPG